ncbi:helix-turn-helix transcriptional regulator [Sphingomonas sp. CFBP9019]|nr:helix-turn-helix transcriptional regulator [Sphingomonas sp. CFBP9019]
MIYEAGLMPALWPRTLDQLAHHFGARGGLLMMKSGTTERWTTSPGLAQIMQDFVDQGWAEHNVRAARCRAASSHPGFLTDRDLLTRNELETLPIYTDFLRPRGLDTGAGTIMQGIQMDGLMLTLEGFPDHDSAKDAVAVLNGLRPHLARASAISARMKLEQATAATEALAAIGTAAAVLASDARVVSVNAEFSNLTKGVLSEKNGRLSIRDSSSILRFDAAFEAANRGLGRSIAVRKGKEAQFVIHFVPSTRSAQDVFFGGTVLVVIDMPSASTVLNIDLIRSLYDLTPAEAKVAYLIAGGETPSGAASALNVSIETVRTHLKRAFAKTGVERQATLSSRLRCMAPRSL